MGATNIIVGKAKASKKCAAWHALEEEVSRRYEELGAIDVECDVDIDGNQIDVFARVPAVDGTYSRSIISCKHNRRPTGVGAVKEHNLVFRALLQTCQADTAVIVSSSGFSRPAKKLAESLGINLMTIEKLRMGGADFSPYLNGQLASISKEPVFENNRYVPMRAQVEGTDKPSGGLELIEDFLDRSSPPLLTLLGDYGSGKTTFCKALFQTFANRYLEGSEGKLRLPIYLSLRDYPGQLNIRSFLLDVLLDQYSCRCQNFGILKNLIADGCVLLILDGFDEMASRMDYQTTLNNFRSIQQILFGDAKVILTCRTHYFKDEEEVKIVHEGTELFQASEGAGYEIAYLEPFGPDEIRSYVKSVCGNTWKRDLLHIEQTYDLMGLAQRPILLDMITQVLPDLINSGRPVNSATLYAQYVQYWLKRDDWRASLRSADRLSFTLAFAEEVYHRKQNVLTWDDVQAAIQKRWPNTSAKQLEQYEYDVRTCTFIRRQGDQYEFVHKSFMEYFVASRLYESLIEDQIEAFTATHHSPEVLNFLAEHMGTKQACDTISKWLNQDQPNDTVTRNVFPLLANWQKPLSIDFKGIQVLKQKIVGSDFRTLEFINTTFDTISWLQAYWEDCTSHLGTWSGCSWTGSTFVNVELLNNPWKDCKMSDTKLTSVLWSSSDLKDIWFNNCIFERVRVVQSKIENCRFNGVQGSIRFSDSELNSCVFCGAGMIGNRYEESVLHRCNFASLTGGGTSYYKTRLEKCRFSFESLDGAVFERVTFSTDITLDSFGIGKTTKRAWQKPPRFSKVKNLKKYIRAHLKEMGAVIKQ